MDLYRQLQEIERVPLHDRREARAEWAQALETPTLIAERVRWLLDGSYGEPAYKRARAIVEASARSNKVAQLGQLIAALEWQCSSAFAREAWNKLAPAKQEAVNDAILREINAAKAEEVQS